MKRIALALVGLVAASVAHADTLKWVWPDVTATWTGTMDRVRLDENGNGHIIFDADAPPVWTDTTESIFGAGFDGTDGIDIAQWSALIALPPPNSWETVSGWCAYDASGDVYTLTCE
jgi:hypothetical protein